MATAITKPTTHTAAPKMKRPPPPFVQTGVNGIKHSQFSPSPQPSPKRLPGTTVQSTSASSVGDASASAFVASSANGVTNNRGPLGDKAAGGSGRMDVQKLGERPPRLQRQLTKTVLGDHGSRVVKRSPEPYVKTTSYILKKFSKSPPSLIVHLYPTHFRFEQQDGSFAYNSEMKIIIEHIRAGTVPHDMIEELLRAGVRFYEGCLVVRVVDHKSASAQAQKSSESLSDDTNEPYSIHNYNEHITPSAFVPYPKHHQHPENTDSKTDSKPPNQPETDNKGVPPDKPEGAAPSKPPVPKPRVFTTVLHPTPRSVQAELTLLATTPDPKASNRKQQTHSHPPSSTALPQSPADTTDRGHVAKRQKMMVEPQDLPECESMLTKALAPPLFLEPVDSLEAVHGLLKFLENPLHRDQPPSPKRRKRTIAELAADEALAAEEERFMLIMDERLGTTASGISGGQKSAGVDDAGGGTSFEPRYARFKTLENIRAQHAEKSKREHEQQVKQELAKRQAQEQERERRRAIEQRQAEEHAKEEARRQQLAAQQAQAHLAAQQQARHALSQASGANQRPQSSPVVRNQTPQNTSSPLVSGSMAPQGGVPMSITASAGSPPRPPSSVLQHAHPNVMGHPMAPSRSQQSRHGTPQMTQGTPAMSHATPIMRNATPTQRMSHGSPAHSSIAPTPVMGHAVMGTPQMGNSGLGMTPQQQQYMMQQRQLLLAQQGQLASHGQFTPQQIAQMQANAHAQQMLQAQQQNQQPQMQKFQNQQQQQVYQAQLMRAQLAQLQMAQQRQQQQQQQQNQAQGQPNQVHQGPTQMSPQQQQVLMAAAQANGGHLPQNLQAATLSQRYHQFYAQKLLHLQQAMTQHYMSQYGPPTQYPPQLAEQYKFGLEKNARTWVQKLIQREAGQHQHRALQAQALQQQQQQQNMMQNGMNK